MSELVSTPRRGTENLRGGLGSATDGAVRVTFVRVVARMPSAPANLDEEQRALLTFLLALRLDRVRDFLGRHELARYGNRAELRERLEENLAKGTIADLVDFLDEVEPQQPLDRHRHSSPVLVGQPREAEQALVLADVGRVVRDGVAKPDTGRLAVVMPQGGALP